MVAGSTIALVNGPVKVLVRYNTTPQYRRSRETAVLENGGKGMSYINKKQEYAPVWGHA